MRLALLLTLVLAGCGSSGPQPYFPSSELGTRVDAVRIPDGYTVRTASFGLAYTTGVSGDSSSISGSSSERPFVNVFAVEESTGRNVLLVYELGRRRDPVLIIELDTSADEAQAAR